MSKFLEALTDEKGRTIAHRTGDRTWKLHAIELDDDDLMELRTWCDDQLVAAEEKWASAFAREVLGK